MKCSVVKAFENANKFKHERDWDTLYVLLDIHGTMMPPNYDGIADVFYPGAIEAMQELCKDSTYKVILWTCSKEEDRNHYKQLLEDRGIDIYAVNCNPDTEGKLDWGDYSQKMYCNVMIDDKAGFEPETDWPEVMKFLKQNQNDKK